MTEETTILCVYDETNVLATLRHLLHEAHYTTLTAESQREALSILELNDNIDLVISNNQLSEANGDDFFCEVHKRWPDMVRIALLDATRTKEMTTTVYLGHIDKFVFKPWSDADILSTVNSALETKQLRKENDQLSLELKNKNQELEQLNNQLLEINENLEKVVEQRTEDLEIRHHILKVSQAILDVLPLAVIGIDPEDLIVSCNRQADELFNNGIFGLLGHDRQSALPQAINELIDRLLKQVGQNAKINYRHQTYQCQLCPLSATTDQGYILVMIPMA